VLFSVPRAIESAEITIFKIGRTCAVTIIPSIVPVAVHGNCSSHIIGVVSPPLPVTVPVPTCTSAYTFVFASKIQISAREAEIFFIFVFIINIVKK
jgi:hypothetical protein